MNGPKYWILKHQIEIVTRSSKPIPSNPTGPRFYSSMDQSLGPKIYPGYDPYLKQLGILDEGRLIGSSNYIAMFHESTLGTYRPKAYQVNSERAKHVIEKLDKVFKDAVASDERYKNARERRKLIARLRVNIEDLK